MREDRPFGAMAPFVRLRTEVEAVLARRGLRLGYVAVVPDSVEVGPHRIQIIAVLAEDPPAASDKELAEEFEAIMRGARAADQEEQARKVVEDLTRRLGEDGFL